MMTSKPRSILAAQRRIARATLAAHPKMVAVMGGMTIAEAKAILKRRKNPRPSLTRGQKIRQALATAYRESRAYASEEGRRIGRKARSAVSAWKRTNPKACPACDGPMYILGTLGSTTWFRCRDCGMESSGRAGAKTTRRRIRPGRAVARAASTADARNGSTRTTTRARVRWVVSGLAVQPTSAGASRVSVHKMLIPRFFKTEREVIAAINSPRYRPVIAAALAAGAVHIRSSSGASHRIQVKK